MSGRLRSPHRHPFGRSRDHHQGEHAGNEAQDRIEPRQEIVQPNKPSRRHARSVALSDGRDNLECVKRAFGHIEGTGQPRHCERSEAIQLPLPQQESWIASSLRSSQ